LVADIGGTNARFALATPDGHIESERTLSGADYPDLVQAATAYLRNMPGPRPRRAAVAVATPITGDWIQFTNSPWSFSIEAARQALPASAEAHLGLARAALRDGAPGMAAELEAAVAAIFSDLGAGSRAYLSFIRDHGARPAPREAPVDLRGPLYLAALAGILAGIAALALWAVRRRRRRRAARAA